jgi:hypothetical protein
LSTDASNRLAEITGRSFIKEGRMVFLILFAKADRIIEMDRDAAHRGAAAA